jgi:hypothetical protein
MLTVMTSNESISRDTPAWRFQVWAAFAIAFGATTIGMLYMPISAWLRAFLAMGYFFSLASSFTLAKTLRDEHEAQKLLSRIQEAKTERILREYEKKAEE